MSRTSNCLLVKQNFAMLKCTARIAKPLDNEQVESEKRKKVEDFVSISSRHLPLNRVTLCHRFQMTECHFIKLLR